MKSEQTSSHNLTPGRLNIDPTGEKRTNEFHNVNLGNLIKDLTHKGQLTRSQAPPLGNRMRKKT